MASGSTDRMFLWSNVSNVRVWGPKLVIDMNKANTTARAMPSGTSCSIGAFVASGNLRTRLNEVESRLQTLGVLP